MNSICLDTNHIFLFLFLSFPSPLSSDMCGSTARPSRAKRCKRDQSTSWTLSTPRVHVFLKFFQHLGLGGGGGPSSPAPSAGSSSPSLLSSSSSRGGGPPPSSTGGGGPSPPRRRRPQRHETDMTQSIAASYRMLSDKEVRLGKRRRTSHVDRNFGNIFTFA